MRSATALWRTSLRAGKEQRAIASTALNHITLETGFLRVTAYEAKNYEGGDSHFHFCDWSASTSYWARAMLLIRKNAAKGPFSLLQWRLFRIDGFVPARTRISISLGFRNHLCLFPGYLSPLTPKLPCCETINTIAGSLAATNGAMIPAPYVR